MERIAFLVEATGTRLGCLLNPSSLVIRRTAGVQQRGSSNGPLSGLKLGDHPLLFTGGGITEITLDLLFDVTLAGSSFPTEDVRDLTRPLFELAETSGNGRSTPPLVRFIWGKSWNILGAITAVAERVEHFNESGAPRRSWLRLRLVRVDEPSSSASAKPLLASNAQWSAADPIPPEQVRIHEIVSGGSADSMAEAETPTRPTERLDEIAYREYGDARHWRLIAALNGIDDPLRLPDGTRLVIPDRSVFERKP